MLKSILKILEEKKHYLETLTMINTVLAKEFPNLVESNFFFRRKNKRIKAVSFERKKQLEVDTLTFPLKKIGEWTVCKEFAFTEYEIKTLVQAAHLISKNVYFEEWEYIYSFYQNKSCKFFPCHEIKDENFFNCLFCYCPLFCFDNCDGNYTLLKNGFKNCIKCALPHQKEKYEYIVDKFSSNNQHLK